MNFKLLKSICKYNKSGFCVEGELNSVNDVEDCHKDNCNLLNKLKKG